MSAQLFDCTGKVTLVTGGNGGIDCVFADSGRSAEQHTLLDMPTAEWHDLLNLDLHGTFFTMREGARWSSARRQANWVAAYQYFRGWLDAKTTPRRRGRWAQSFAEWRSSLANTASAQTRLRRVSSSPGRWRGRTMSLTCLLSARRLAMRAQVHLDASRPLEAIHLLDVALGADTENLDSLHVKKAALNQWLTASGVSNLSETMWLKSEIAAIDAALASTGL